MSLRNIPNISEITDINMISVQRGIEIKRKEAKEKALELSESLSTQIKLGANPFFSVIGAVVRFLNKFITFIRGGGDAPSNNSPLCKHLKTLSDTLQNIIDNGKFSDGDLETLKRTTIEVGKIIDDEHKKIADRIEEYQEKSKSEQKKLNENFWKAVASASAMPDGVTFIHHAVSWGIYMRTASSLGEINALLRDWEDTRKKMTDCMEAIDNVKGIVLRVEADVKKHISINKYGDLYSNKDKIDALRTKLQCSC